MDLITQLLIFEIIWNILDVKNADVHLMSILLNEGIGSSVTTYFKEIGNKPVIFLSSLLTAK
jgi:hypothetical protein